MTNTSEPIAASVSDGNAAAQNPSTPTTSTSTSGSSLLGESTSTTTTPTTEWIDKDGNFTEGWVDRLGEEFKDSKQIISPFKDLKGMAKTLVSQQRMLGKKNEAVLIPGEKATPEERAEFHRKLGVPDSPDKYPARPDFLPQDYQWDESVAKEFNKLAYENGVTPAQHEAYLKRYAAFETQRSQQAEAAQQQAFEADRKALGDEWGDKFAENAARVTRLWQYAGEKTDDPALNIPTVVRALARIATGLNEDKMVSSNANSASMLVGKDRALDIMRNPQNPLHELYKGGDKDTATLVTRLLGGN
jgi:hypothetical protein